MVNRARARGLGSGASRPKKVNGLKFRVSTPEPRSQHTLVILTWLNAKCETCQIGEKHRPCRSDVVWASYIQNPHLMETGWIHRAKEEGKFDIIAEDGKRHTLVICRTAQAPPQSAAATPLTKSALECWRRRAFGRASILDALEKSQEITFRLDDQIHWFDQTKTRLVLRPSRVIEVVDTEGKKYSVYRPGQLAKHEIDSFIQWKLHLKSISQRLMGENLAERFTIRVDPLWSNYDSERMPQPVGSQTPLDRFDWDYDADVSQDLEQHIAKNKQIVH